MSRAAGPSVAVQVVICVCCCHRLRRLPRSTALANGTGTSATSTYRVKVRLLVDQGPSTAEPLRLGIIPTDTDAFIQLSDGDKKKRLHMEVRGML